METIGLICAGLAALVHGYIFWLESLAFAHTGRKVFGINEADAQVARPWAFNQGFYNLFLGLGTAAGVIRAFTGDEAGLGWVDFGLLCMLGAALVLILSDRRQVRGALVQGIFPLLGLVFLGLAHL